MKILITGGSGQLGRALRHALGDHELVMLDREAYSLRPGQPLAGGGAPPAFIVHAAALTNTQRCEREPNAAYQVNGRLPGTVAAWASSVGARGVFVSTNEVFPGTEEAPWGEDAETRAVNVYGASKLLGEQAVAEASGHHMIVRTAWLYGDSGDNFVEKVLAAARDERPLRFVTDEIATPTSAHDLAAAIRALVEKSALGGIYHLTNEGEASRYEWAREIMHMAGLDSSRVEPVTMSELRASGYDGPKKPPYSVLANTRARALGITLRPWREALAAYFERARVAADG